MRKKSINYIFLALLALPVISFSSENEITINSKNNIQGIYPAKGKQFYTLEHEASDNIPRIFLNDNNTRKLIVSDFDIAHQGFSVIESKDKSEYFVWTGDKKSPYGAILFVIGNGQIITKKRVKVFDSTFFRKNETMPTVSIEHDKIIFRGRKSSREMIFRIFDYKKTMEAIKSRSEQVIDLSSDYETEWKLPLDVFTEDSDVFRPLQAISYSNKKIYLLLGNARINYKSIFAFDVNGREICSNTRIDDGIGLAKLYLKDNFYEPEGIFVLDNELSLLFTIAKNKNIRNVILKISNDICLPNNKQKAI